MKKSLFVIIILAAGLCILVSCHKNKCENDVHPLIFSYCPEGPNSCTSNLITVQGYLDDINIHGNKFFMYSDINRTTSNDNCLNSSYIEVYYPTKDLSTIFNYDGTSYRPGFDVKVVINNAKILVFHRDNPGKDDGNYLQVDSIQQIEFYKIEINGALTRLLP